jgi:hypothetical protein
MKHIITVALILAASAAHADTKTVSWFVAHPEARAKVYRLCQDNPGEAGHVPNCLNAFEAGQLASNKALERQIEAGRGRTMLEDCDKQGFLFQAANRCGQYRPQQ